MSASDDEPKYFARGSTIYEGLELIGVMTSPERAAEFTDALNARHRVLAAPGRDQAIADRRSLEARDMEIHEPRCHGAVGGACRCGGPR